MGKIQTFKCSECEHCKNRGGLMNTRGSFICEHPNGEYIRQYFKEHRIRKMEGFIGFGEKFSKNPSIKTSPRWCPKKAGGGMNNQEAIKIFKEAEGIEEQIPHLIDAYRVAIEALEKQIPKKPEKLEWVENYKYGVCVRCGCGVNTPMNYCDECGQAILWEE